MILDALISTNAEEFQLVDIKITAEANETTVIIGPNGSGKTTALRTIAGLTKLSAGRISIDSKDVEDPERGVWVAPENRPIAMVMQEANLFPHLSARANVAFGLEAQGVPRREAQVRANEILSLLEMEHVAKLRPRQLSGGEGQMVALARALIIEPRVLLLDEPFSSLDATNRSDMGKKFRSMLDDYSGARVLVTHDPVEAISLGDHFVVIEDGRVVQSGSANELRNNPKTRYVADLLS